MGCCQSGKQGTAAAAQACQTSHGTAATDGDVGTGSRAQSAMSGHRSASPSSAPNLNSKRRSDDTTDEIRRSYLQGQLKVGENCPLTDRQLYGLIKSWKAINRNMSVTAINMFVRYKILK